MADVKLPDGMQLLLPSTQEYRDLCGLLTVPNHSISKVNAPAGVATCWAWKVKLPASLPVRVRLLF